MLNTQSSIQVMIRRMVKARIRLESVMVRRLATGAQRLMDPIPKTAVLAVVIGRDQGTVIEKALLDGEGGSGMALERDLPIATPEPIAPRITSHPATTAPISIAHPDPNPITAALSNQQDISIPATATAPEPDPITAALSDQLGSVSALRP